MSVYSSIYIPRMSIEHTEDFIKQVMSFYHIGIVDYVDFTPINKKPGFGENVNQVVKSAFVHFSDPLLCDDKVYHFQCKKGYRAFWQTIGSNNSYRLQINTREYWICLKNKNPVQRTMMNIHQVVDNGRHLENLIEKQNKKIHDLENKIDSIDCVLRQLIGGLYCQQTQSGIYELHNRILNGNGDGDNKPLPDDTHSWKCWPTTRQGDACEKRIDKLEKIFADNEHQDSVLLMRKQTKVSEDSQRITALEERLNTLIEDLDTYDILRY